MFLSALLFFVIQGRTLLFVVIQGRATVYRGYFTSCEQCRTIIDVSTDLCISVYDLRVKTFNLVLMTPTAQVYIDLVYKEIKKKVTTY